MLAAISYGYLSYPRTAYQHCTAIIYQAQKDDCIDGIANSTGNYSACSAISGQLARSYCVYNVAIRSNDLGTCSLIAPISSYHDRCIDDISVATRNISSCSELGGGGASCQLSIIEEQNFSSMGECSLLQNHSLSRDCISLYYYNHAAAARNISYCSRINYSDNFSVGQAFRGLLGNQSYDYWYYYGFMNISLGDYCRINLARVIGNGEQCANLGQNASALCYSVVGTAALNQSIGNSTSDEQQIMNLTNACSNESNYSLAMCEYSLDLSKAAISGNAAYCEQINSTMLQDTCITTLAVNLGNASYCSYIGNLTVKSGCLLSLAANSSQGG